MMSSGGGYDVEAVLRGAEAVLRGVGGGSKGVMAGGKRRKGRSGRGLALVITIAASNAAKHDSASARPSGECPGLRRLYHLRHGIPKRAVRYSWIAKAGPGRGYMHMAMLERMGNGTLIAAWQWSEAREGTPSQRLAYAVSRDGSEGKRGLPWDTGSGGDRAQWSPVLHRDTRGRIWLFYTESNQCQFTSGDYPHWMPGGDIKATLLNPKTGQWRAPRVILSEESEGVIPKVLANKLIVLTSGEWVLPFWREAHGAGTTCPQPKSASWDPPRGAVQLPYTWLIENTVVELHGGVIAMFFRTYKGFIYQSFSSDTGLTWSPAEPTSLANPDAKIHAMRMSEGSVAMAFNNHQKLHSTACPKCRTALQVAVSADDRLDSWRTLAHIEDTVDPGLRVHYPTMLQVGCSLLVAYSQFYHPAYANGSVALEPGIRLAVVPLQAGGGGHLSRT
eukprot:jgi/Chlat1/7487/Chrsp60S06998